MPRRLVLQDGDLFLRSLLLRLLDFRLFQIIQGKVLSGSFCHDSLVSYFLFTDPGSGNGEPFFVMMRDFVDQHRDGFASTDDFRRVANEHFLKTPIAKSFGFA